MIDITVIIPTFNEATRIKRCLNSIVRQNYSRSKVQILVVDDNSTDKTREIARSFNCTVITNGTHNIERGKSLGFEKARGTYIFFIDADNVLLDRNWFSKSVDLLEKDSTIIGVQSYKYKYYASDPAANRYCSLFGINDPMAFYLGKRGQLQAIEHSWIYPKTLQYETHDFFVCKFTPDNLPTVGSQGYMTRRSLLMKTTWKPYLFHMDSVYELVLKGKSTIAFIKSEVRHDYAQSVQGIVKKLRRNIVLFYKQNTMRKYTYDIKPVRLFQVVLAMSTFVIPFYDSLKGFIRKPDLAWFIHPILSFTVVVVYGYTTLEQKLLKLFSR